MKDRTVLGARLVEPPVRGVLTRPIPPVFIVRLPDPGALTRLAALALLTGLLALDLTRLLAPDLTRLLALGPARVAAVVILGATAYAILATTTAVVAAWVPGQTLASRGLERSAVLSVMGAHVVVGAEQAAALFGRVAVAVTSPLKFCGRDLEEDEEDAGLIALGCVPPGFS